MVPNPYSFALYQRDLLDEAARRRRSEAPRSLPGSRHPARSWRAGTRASGGVASMVVAGLRRVLATGWGTIAAAVAGSWR